MKTFWDIVSIFLMLVVLGSALKAAVWIIRIPVSAIKEKKGAKHIALQIVISVIALVVMSVLLSFLFPF